MTTWALRGKVRWLLMLLLSIPVFGQQQATRASDFINSVGVNTHFSYTDTAYYQQPAAIIAAIHALGVHHVRDGLAYTWVAPHLYSIYAQLAQAGIHPELITPNPSHGGPSAEAMKPLLPNYTGVEAIEAPNEYDQANNPNWVIDLRVYLPAVWQLGNDAGIPVIGPSLTQPGSYPLLGNVGAYENYGNLHAYWGGRNPETGGWGGPDAQGHAYGSFAFDFDSLNITNAGKPVMMTETGYIASNTPKQNVVPEAVEAVYMPRLVLHAWNLGIKRTYIYELMDDPSSPVGFGLLRGDLTPRPAYTALATLMHLLADSPGARTAESLSYSLQGDASGLETTLLEKQDGSFWLAIWIPAPIYEVNQLHPISVPPHTITLKVASGKTIQNSWVFNDNGEADEKLLNTDMVTLSIGSAVTLLQIQ